MTLDKHGGKSTRSPAGWLEGSRRSGLVRRRRSAGDCRVGRHGHAAQACAGGGEDGVADSGGNTDEARFAGAGGGDVFAVEQHNLDVWSVGEARQAIALEVGIDELAVGE